MLRLSTKRTVNITRNPRVFKVGHDTGIDYDGLHTYRGACIKAECIRARGHRVNNLMVIDTRTGRAVSEVIGFDYENG
jgi:hypothetical protein